VETRRDALAYRQEREWSKAVMAIDVRAFRTITAALGFVLIGKLLFDYFSGSPQVRNHPDPRVRRLNRLRVYSIIVCFACIVIASPAYRVGLPFTGVLVLFGIAVAAMLVCFVCTFRVAVMTRRL
jgi:hypothetical protein